MPLEARATGSGPERRRGCLKPQELHGRAPEGRLGVRQLAAAFQIKKAPHAPLMNSRDIDLVTWGFNHCDKSGSKLPHTVKRYP